jgi:hypothetical protein
MNMTNETKIEVLKQENKELRELLEIQNGKLERAVYAICRLHSGLYYQVSQHCILEKKNALLLGIPFTMVSSEEEEEITTHQGDDHELRIQHLEQTIEVLERKISSFEKNP